MLLCVNMSLNNSINELKKIIKKASNDKQRLKNAPTPNVQRPINTPPPPPQDNVHSQRLVR